MMYYLACLNFSIKSSESEFISSAAFAIYGMFMPQVKAGSAPNVELNF